MQNSRVEKQKSKFNKKFKDLKKKSKKYWEHVRKVKNKKA